MFGLRSDLPEIRRLGDLLQEAPVACDVVVCPPATLLGAASAEARGFSVGVQDCHEMRDGAFTGDVSAEMAADAGAAFAIVGHSERRHGHGETGARVRAKADAALRAGLSPIVCVGETRAERDGGRTLEVLRAQTVESMPTDENARVALAYEPVWAIGTGLTPTDEEIDDAHRFLRSLVGAKTRILYGGSVKPANSAAILRRAEVDGVLVGGASLKAEDFIRIIRSAP